MIELTSARRRALRLLLVVVAGGVLLAVLGLTAKRRAEAWLRAKVIATLQQRLNSDVELRAISVQPGLVTRISGGPLTIRHRERREAAPLIHFEHFETTLTWHQLLSRPRRVDAVIITGLAIAIPPSPAPGEPRIPRDDDKGEADARDDEKAASASVTAQSPEGQPAEGRAASTPAVVIGRITTDGATLVILPRDRRKLPRRFVLHRLTVRDISTDRPMAFDAVIENPQPRGRIETTGTFGPWNVDQPSQTPLQARYRFRDADLGTIRGLAGVLQSDGTFGGVLERIEAVGTSTTPAFDLDVGGLPLPLTTRFTVIVDGTNGNTYIQPAEALLGKATPIRVTGGVVKAEDRRGRTVDLAMAIAGGRLEEALALVVDGEPAMRGRVDVDASLLIPPGPDKVAHRMVLEGRFSLAETTFTSRELQRKLDELSRRAQGRPDDPEITGVVSAFTGRFRMAEGVIRLPALSFEVDGARVDLAGQYEVAGQRLHFDGRIRLVAGVSRMIRGNKRWLLRPFDALFRRHGATEFPITIRGTAKQPEFGVDVKETLGRALLPGK